MMRISTKDTAANTTQPIGINTQAPKQGQLSFADIGMRLAYHSSVPGLSQGISPTPANPLAINDGDTETLGQAQPEGMTSAPTESAEKLSQSEGLEQSTPKLAPAVLDDLESISSASIPTSEPSNEKAPDPDDPPPKNGGEAGLKPEIVDQQQSNPIFMAFKKSYDTELFHTMHKISFIDVQDKEIRKTMPIWSKEFKFLLLNNHFSQVGELPPKSEVQEALEMLEGVALFGSPEKTIHVRKAKVDGDIYFDLGGVDYEQVKITKDGWSVIYSSESPVHFVRPVRMRPMPHPEQGGSLGLLPKYINVQDPQDLALIIGWLVGAMNTDGPYPILVLNGEQGSGKTTVSRLIVDLVDPSSPGASSPPRSERDLIIAAGKTSVLCFDNMSSIPPWLADALCRLSTGGGFATRTLRTDDHETSFEGRKATILNAIPGLLERPDFAERAIAIVCPPIPKGNRRVESEIQMEWEADKPKILGALFNAVAAGLRNIDSVELPELPRMADFAKLVAAAAADGALPCTSEFFLNAYSDNRMDMVDDALEVDPICQAVKQLLIDNNGLWSGTPSELLVTFNLIDLDNVQKQRDWPKQPNVLSGRLRRAATFLREKDIEISWSKSGNRNISIKWAKGVGEDLEHKIVQVREGFSSGNVTSEALQTSHVENELLTNTSAVSANADEIKMADDADDQKAA